MDENTNPAGAGGAPSGDDLLRKLALALLAPRYMGAESTAEPQLLVGELPPDLPFGIPLPEGAQVLGALLGGMPTIAIETSLAPEATIDFYRTALAAEGWSEEASPGFGRGGFVHSAGNRVAMVTFDRGEAEPSLRITCFETPGDVTSLQIHVAGPPHEPHFRERRMLGHGPMNLLPAIMPPPHSTQQGGGGGSSDNHVDSRATLDTNLDVQAVGAHYRTQLERAGWQLSASGESSPVAWSTWTFKDDDTEPWSATFAALQQAHAPRRYDLWLSANYAGSKGRPRGLPIGSQGHSSTSWTSYGPMQRGR